MKKVILALLLGGLLLIPNIGRSETKCEKELKKTTETLIVQEEKLNKVKEDGLSGVLCGLAVGASFASPSILPYTLGGSAIVLFYSWIVK